MPAVEVLAVANNLIEALRFFGRARADAQILERPGVTVILCGLNYAAFNAGLLSEPVTAGEGELELRIRAAAREFGSRRFRWSYWVCDDFLSPHLRRVAPAIFARHGLRPLTEAPGMFADRLQTPRRALPTLDCRPVADAATRSAFVDLMSAAFDIPPSVSASIYGAERAWRSDFRGFVGYSDGKAVTSAASTITSGTVGLYSVATLPGYRRRGFAEAIIRRVAEEAIRSAPAGQPVESTVLQSTWSGLSLYEQMGYRTVTNFHVYIAD
ncbi:MAG TPA: GNAT family N-acetyltransferase [Bryobacteraceae bacterium]|nr:GNAT family N-acetyltransferase [Bryobacteraceae bacterium]